ncbi:MAG: bifunctional phosphoribosylaminoimidazolecarboxamide formyltransferase/IMP cyclohydrolase [Geminicoccaceae bacterium]
MTRRPIRRALLSVHDKTGLADLGKGLVAHGVELLSTGGTAAALRAAGLPVTEVAEVTGAPEILDGRVKTLHPAVHGGILAKRDDPAHMATLAEHKLPPIDLVVVNLYPFEATLASGADFKACVEQIDVGGPAMVRAAAKNHDGVAVLVDAADYPAVLEQLAAGGTDDAFRRRMAAKAFATTASYDAAIAGWLARETAEPFPERIVLAGRRRQLLRYGENPHQRAAWYATGQGSAALAGAVQLQGKELSYNNLNDADAALALVGELTEPGCVIVKHANPCGVALGANAADAYRKALATDPTSAFGGIVAFNRPLDEATAKAVTQIFTEVVIAPGADEAARALFAAKTNLRLLLLEQALDTSPYELRTLAGGFLIQERDTAPLVPADLTVVTRREPSNTELADLLFAWTVVKHAKSNAIVLAYDRTTVGIGMGQTSRVDAVRQAATRAGRRPCVVASDAFFPFPDGLEAAIATGATAAIQPGGSVKDDDVIATADKAGIAMVFTGVRHFRH